MESEQIGTTTLLEVGRVTQSTKSCLCPPFDAAGRVAPFIHEMAPLELEFMGRASLQTRCSPIPISMDGGGVMPFIFLGLDL